MSEKMAQLQASSQIITADPQARPFVNFCAIKPGSNTAKTYMYKSSIQIAFLEPFWLSFAKHCLHHTRWYTRCMSESHSSIASSSCYTAKTFFSIHVSLPKRFSLFRVRQHENQSPSVLPEEGGIDFTSVKSSWGASDGIYFENTRLLYSAKSMLRRVSMPSLSGLS